jgi:hypothetical protein
VDVDGLAPGDVKNDEYSGQVSRPVAGTFAYAYRFSTDGAATWTLCDRTWGDGYVAMQAGVLTVTGGAGGGGSGGAGVAIGWCELRHPMTTMVVAGQSSEVVYGRVFVAGVTPAAGAGPGITGQVGFGAVGAAPSTWTSWSNAQYARDVDGANDEYEASMQPFGPGTFNYAYRFSGNSGASWTYCDLNGSTDGFSTPGTMTVMAP